MKKTYMTPEAEKIQFNYRDQVVAASGDTGGTTGSGSSGYEASICEAVDQIVGYLLDYAGMSICS